MGRQVRQVPADWKHPTTWNPEGTCFDPLHDRKYYAEAKREWLETLAKVGLQRTLDDLGGAPDERDYMPNWPESEKTHFMMYEDTSEGTPISPAFPTIEELARWLADTKASVFGDCIATYERWLEICQDGCVGLMMVKSK